MGYQPGTLNWFLDSTILTAWLAADNHSEDRTRNLWCYGMMGMGKPILASRIVEELVSSATPQPRTAVVYCFHTEQKYSTVELVIGTILAQLFKGSGERSELCN